MKRTNFHITERQLERLRSLSDATGLSVAEIVRRAIDAHLDEVERIAEIKTDRKEKS